VTISVDPVGFLLTVIIVTVIVAKIAIVLFDYLIGEDKP